MSAEFQRKTKIKSRISYKYSIKTHGICMANTESGEMCLSNKDIRTRATFSFLYNLFITIIFRAQVIGTHSNARK